MAENKKSFVLYADLIGNIDHLTNEEKGILFNHLLEYVNDKNPILEDRVLISVWKPIQRQLKRDLEKYEEKKGKKSISGREGNLKRWHLDLYNEYKKGTYTLFGAESIANGRKSSQPDSTQSQIIPNIAVNDNVNDNVITNTEKADDVFLEYREKYKVYALQLMKDRLWLESIGNAFMKGKEPKTIVLTIRKYMELFLNRLDQDKKIHNNKRDFTSHFPNWLRKQEITFIHPKQEPIRYV